MLDLIDITKRYEIGTFRQTALDSVRLSFRNHEFVAVTGPSGSGKTTLLNMIGGLDRFDSGDLLIDGKSTAHFSEAEWDAYRNHSIGFVFQTYNLIHHMSVLANVEIGLTLSGVSAEERRQRALDVLKKVGLSDHVHKKPNQLSGGQMQRVAIARALVNDPDIILADEPTGAIDSETSKQIMDLIRNISKEKLVIMVTHDEGIAKAYAHRLVSLKDGRIESDSNPYHNHMDKEGRLRIKKTAMAFSQALKLSFSNLKTKKFRTIITAFAGSIGIIGIALVLSIANGMNREIDRLERTTLAEFPIQIDPVPFDLDAAREQGGPPGRAPEPDDLEKHPDGTTITPYERTLRTTQHVNVITDDYLDHIDALDESLYNEVAIERRVNMNLLRQRETGEVINVNTGHINFSQTLSKEAFFDDTYDILEGRRPDNEHELLLVIDEYNRLNARIINALGLSDTTTYQFEDFIGMRFTVALLDEYYVFNETSDLYRARTDLGDFFDTDDLGIDVEIVGIARMSDDAVSSFLSPGIKHHPDLTALYLEDARTSEIGMAQMESDTSVITGLPLSSSAKQAFLRTLGVDSTPVQIRIYPASFEDKDAITAHLDAFNEGREESEEIRYTDIAAIVIAITGDVIDGISYVLVAFSAISLVVSSIMIGIITYVSVLERTKEIGILRSLGARKKDITSVFNAETVIIGFIAGVLGITIAWGLTFPINVIIRRLVDGVENVAVMPLTLPFILIMISIALTFISGLIPARIASNKHPVEALRIE